MNPMIPKDFPSRSTCFADSHFDFLSYFPGWFVNFAICRIRSDSLSCISSNADDSLVIKCYLVLIELVKYILCFSLTIYGNLIFCEELFSIRNSFTALQAQINIAIRINAAIFVEIFKGNKIFNSKVHYFMVSKTK
jgi:hypothetical protein